MQEILYRAPRLTTLLLALAAVIITGWQAYRFWLDIQAPYVAPVSDPVARETPQSRPDVELASVDFFGSPSAGDEPVVTNTEDLPETNLRLTLRGVGARIGEKNSAAAANAQADDTTSSVPASALIEGPDQETLYYVVGASLPGDASLKAVYADRVVLERQGKLENLYFPEEFESSHFESQASPGSSAGDTPSQSAPQSAGRQAATQAEQTRKAEIRARLERLRERLRNNN